MSKVKAVTLGFYRGPFFIFFCLNFLSRGLVGSQVFKGLLCPSTSLRPREKGGLFFFSFFSKNERFSPVKALRGSLLPRRIRERVLGGLFLRFLEFLFGGQIFFFFVRNSWASLNSFILTQEYLFARRISQYGSSSMKRRRGQWWWGSRILALAVRSRDPELLVSWVQTRLKFMSLYSHRRFFRLLGLLLRGAVKAKGVHNLRGFYMRVVGKISVVGNAMSRVWWTRGGLAAGSNLTLQVYPGFTLVRTSTGCLGLSFFFFY